MVTKVYNMIKVQRQSAGGAHHNNTVHQIVIEKKPPKREQINASTWKIYSQYHVLSVAPFSFF